MKYTTTAFFVLLNLFAQAQTKTWDGGAGTNNWEDANNWNPNGVPSILNDVEIDNDSVSINANTNVKSILLESTHATETNQAIFLQNGVTLSVFNSTSNGLELEDEARFWNAGNLVIINTAADGLLVNSGRFENMASQGEVYISLCSSGIVNKGTFQNRNNAEVNINDVNFFGFDNNSTSSQSSNRGSITIYDGQFGFNNDGTYLNRGELNIYSSTQIGLVTNNDFQNLSNGVISIDSLQDEGIFASSDFINEGALNIKGGLHNGIEDFGLLNLVNSGTIYISKSAENGIELDNAGSSLLNEIGGEIIIDSTTKEGVLTNQLIKNNGEIFINETTEDGIVLLPGTSGSILNNGLIHIKNTGEHGIGITDGLFKSEVGAQIIVENTGGSGIFTFKKLVNTGSIIIKKSDTYGIHSRDSLVNHGQIEIDESVLAGFFQEEYFLNTSGASLEISNTVNKGVISFDKLVNEGSISINNSGTGVFIDTTNLDSLVNNGSITILRSETNGIEHQGTVFINTDEGEILIDSTGLSCFKIENKFTNEGEITIKRAGTHGIHNTEINTDSLLNNGVFIIESSQESGIHNEGALVFNQSEGEISIDSSGAGGFYTSGKFNNDGSLVISNSLYEGLAIGYFGDSVINNSLITIYNSGGDGMVNEGERSLVNTILGEIIIDSSGDNGFFNDGKFINDGILYIQKAGFHGLEIETRDSLINNGLIRILNSTNDGIKNYSLKTYNSIHGEIIIDSTGDVGFYNEEKFVNDGSLSISNSEETGLQNSDTLINNGFVKVENAGTFGIVNTGNFFLNGSCGVFKLNGSISISSSILNKGLIEGPNFSLFFNSTDSLVNDGTMYIRNPISSPYFVNNGNLIYPFEGTLSDGVKEMNITTVGVSPIQTIASTWWVDEAKTVIAGTYDNIEQSFTPNTAGISADTLWLELNSVNCAILVGIPVNQIKPCFGVISTFTGAVSSDWHTAANWNNGVVPSYCTVVVIPASQTCTITTGRKARAYRIEAETGSVFDAELGVVLDVNPEN
ncbi:hypothetical protein [uncultured Arcticibacterium sp.]|uniref:hypothetical protein n=1 Tax=uncultured Arcticibacterium sp. TaxID=2173042 RepID=UPI0030F9C811